MEQARLPVREDGDTELWRGWMKALGVEIDGCGAWGSKEGGPGGTRA